MVSAREVLGQLKNAMLGVGQSVWTIPGSFIEAYHSTGRRSWLIFDMHGRQVYRYTYVAKMADEDDWPTIRRSLVIIQNGNPNKVIRIARHRADIRLVMFATEAAVTDIAIRLAMTRRNARVRLVSVDQEPLWVEDLELAEPILKRCNATGG